MANNRQILPWVLHPLESWVKEEFDRRSNEYGMDPSDDYKKYKGPKAAWGRVFSNGISSLAKNKDGGFIMGGTEGFDESYGFGSDGKITIGVDASGRNRHEIDATYDNAQNGLPDFPHRPPPGIVSIDTEFDGTSNSSYKGALRKTKITWKCYSLSQLEYLTPYFLTPRISVVAEWGWNHYDKESLIDLENLYLLRNIFEGNPEVTSNRIEKAGGNYDFCMGIITDYGYSLNEFGGYDCYTTITNANYLMYGKSTRDGSASKIDYNKQNVKLKDFSEFVFNDMTNLLTVKNKNAKIITPASNALETLAAAEGAPIMLQTEVRDDSTDLLNIPFKGKIFKNDDGEKWLKMDLIVDIINKFSEVQVIDKDGKSTPLFIGSIDIKNVPVVAHPALKSTSINFIIPNQFAPRFVSNKNKEEDLTGKNLGNAKIPTGEYHALFPSVMKLIKDSKLDETYDDLVEALKTQGVDTRSFPMYSNYNENSTSNRSNVGYWGYLEDIFVSEKYFIELVKTNDTIAVLMKTLFENLSHAMCNISNIKLDSEKTNNTVMRAVDHNFTPVTSPDDVKDFVRISLGSINSAFLRTADFSIKLSSEMSNQMMAQSVSGKDMEKGYGTPDYNPSDMQVSQHSLGDRMIDRIAIPKQSAVPSNTDPSSNKLKYTRELNEYDSRDFNILKIGPGKVASIIDAVGNYAMFNSTTSKTQGKLYILAEKSPDYLKKILWDKGDKKAIHVNNVIMPGTELKMELLGIGGITFLSQFTLDHVPSSYNYERAVWQVSQVSQKVENKVWTTTVMAQARPLTAFEKL
jgi:hypothetical protein